MTIYDYTIDYVELLPPRPTWWLGGAPAPANLQEGTNDPGEMSGQQAVKHPRVYQPLFTQFNPQTPIL